MRIISLLLVAFLLAGCGKATKPAAERPADKIIATVNGEPIYNKDVKEALALRLKNNPSFKVTPNTLKEQIDLVIDERLSLQHKQRSNSRIEILTK
jgi:PBP1b-binding outer membrane lipoprotein LpoB